MPKYLLLILFFLSCFFVKNGSSQTTTTDTTKIKVLVNQAMEYSFQNNDSSTIFIQNALDLATDSLGQFFAFETIKTMNHQLLQMGNMPLALTHFEQLDQFVRQVGNDSLIAINNYGLAVLISEQGDFLKSLQLLNQTKELLQNYDISPRQDATIKILAASCYQYLEKMDSAIYNYVEALKIGQKEGLADKENTALTGLSAIYLKQNNYAKAIEYSNLEMESSKKIGHPIRLAATYMNAAKIYAQRFNGPEKQEGDLELAERYLKRTLELASDYPPLVAVTIFNLGVLYYDQGLI